MGAKLQRIAQKLADKMGVEECRLTSATFSNSMFEIKESKFLTVVTFGRVLGFSVDLWTDNNHLTARLKLKLRKKS